MRLSVIISDYGFQAIHPYFSKNAFPDHPQSNTIRLFKSGFRPALKHYFYILLKLTQKHIKTPHIVVTVPSSNANKTNSITKIAKALPLKNTMLIDGTTAIKKKFSTKSFCTTNNRNIDNLAASLEIKTEMIKNKDILLLDDVTTTGKTFELIENLLLQAGANSVTCLALAHTKRLYK